jgi:hypothetical protein
VIIESIMEEEIVMTQRTQYNPVLLLILLLLVVPEYNCCSSVL